MGRLGVTLGLPCATLGPPWGQPGATPESPWATLGALWGPCEFLLLYDHNVRVTINLVNVRLIVLVGEHFDL